MMQLRTINFLASLLLVVIPFSTADAGEILEKPQGARRVLPA